MCIRDRLNVSQAENMLKDHGYVSNSYDDELAGYLDWTGLEDRDVVIQYPYTCLLYTSDAADETHEV